MVQVTPSITLSNVTLSNNLLLNSYLYVLNMHVYFYTNWILFTIRLINPSLMHHYKLQNFEFKHLIDDMTIDFLLLWNFASIDNICR